MTRFSTTEILDLLRDRGLRVTPQRRAILGAFRGGRSEHLSADEVYLRACELVPELSRATVYATLAEFREVGLLAAFGTPEPVRYETAVKPHAHFRCDLCLRVFDLPSGRPDPAQILNPGFTARLVETRVDGVCDECNEYAAGLQAGADAMRQTRPPAGTPMLPGAAVIEMPSPVGPLFLAATPGGLTRLAFEDHGDAAALSALAGQGGGARAARQHLAHARNALDRYFAGEPATPTCVVDWEPLAPSSAAALRATERIAYAAHRCYTNLDLEISPRDLGLTFGANPIPIIVPCHRVTQGAKFPAVFVGGSDRRRWLIAHERAHSRA